MTKKKELFCSINKIKNQFKSRCYNSNSFYKNEINNSEESLAFNDIKNSNLEMIDVFISRIDWSSRRKDILTEIYRFHIKNIDEISLLIKKNGYNDNLYSLIKTRIYSNLITKTNL